MSVGAGDPPRGALRRRVVCKLVDELVHGNHAMRPDLLPGNPHRQAPDETSILLRRRRLGLPHARRPGEDALVVIKDSRFRVAPCMAPRKSTRDGLKLRDDVAVIACRLKQEITGLAMQFSPILLNDERPAVSEAKRRVKAGSIHPNIHAIG